MIKEFQGKYRFLSNFWMAPIVLFGSGTDGKPDDIAFSVEHAYQALKADNEEDYFKVLRAASPGEAKRLGKTIKIVSTWEESKLGIMSVLVQSKFEQHEELRKMLLETGDEELVEGNKWHDNYWGKCYCPKCDGWTGENKLGILLMAIRKEYKDKRDT